MHTSTKEAEELYSIIGALLYCVAISDRRVRPEEVDALESKVIDHWATFPKVEKAYFAFATSSILNSFHQSVDECKDSESAFHRFKSVRQTQPDYFTPTLCAYIFRSATMISTAVSRNNKSELVLLSQLEILLYPNKSYTK